jgi:hypothetical protein
MKEVKKIESSSQDIETLKKEKTTEPDLELQKELDELELRLNTMSPEEVSVDEEALFFDTMPKEVKEKIQKHRAFTITFPIPKKKVSTTEQEQPQCPSSLQSPPRDKQLPISRRASQISQNSTPVTSPLDSLGSPTSHTPFKFSPPERSYLDRRGLQEKKTSGEEKKKEGIDGLVTLGFLKSPKDKVKVSRDRSSNRNLVPPNFDEMEFFRKQIEGEQDISQKKVEITYKKQ